MSTESVDVEQKSGIKRRGFGSMTQERIREITSMGGIASQQSGRAHKWTSEEAAKAGSIGGKRSKRPATSYNKRVPEGEQLV